MIVVSGLRLKLGSGEAEAAEAAPATGLCGNRRSVRRDFEIRLDGHGAAGRGVGLDGGSHAKDRFIKALWRKKLF